jgi:hypothetical protein
MKTHYLKLDHLKSILEIIISGFDNSINVLRERIDKIHWYDGSWFIEEVEPIVGLAFIAYQNYINSSIYDRFGNLNNKLEVYKNGSGFIDKKRTEIELIVAIANYFKHRDDEQPLHKGTQAVFEDLHLEFIDINAPELLPILRGFHILSDSWNLNDVTKIVTDWRESLWVEE